MAGVAKVPLALWLARGSDSAQLAESLLIAAAASGGLFCFSLVWLRSILSAPSTQSSLAWR